MAVVDAVIIGSGAGGAPIAYELARAGLRCVVLEKGRALTTRELCHDEVDLCRRDFFVPYVHHEPHTLRRDGAPRATPTNEGWTANVVGGGTVHMGSYFMRMHPVDLRLRSTLGAIAGARIADWPISYEELEPYYRRAEEEVGVSGRWRRHPFEEPRSSDYPLPPLDEHAFAARIDAAAGKLGVHPFPTPRGIVSRAYRGRKPCVYCDRCGSYGCEVGAKSSTAVALLPQAIATGLCELRAGCMATEILVDGTGNATGVVYRDGKGASTRVSARVVVVAASGIESARLLLSSQSSRFPRGLGNDSGLVGKNLVFSGAGEGYGLFHRGVDRAWLDEGSPFVQRSMQDFYLLDRPRDGMRKAGTILFDLFHANPIYNAERVAGHGADVLWGATLKQALRDEAAGARCLGFETFSEFLPTAGSFVDLDPDVKDRWGAPVARMTIDRHALDRKATDVLVEHAVTMMRELGADTTKVTVTDGEKSFMHGGTCRFGVDPAESVLDASCRMHTAPNVYVTDGSFLPTSGGVPLTLTILANAFRVGEILTKRLRGEHHRHT